MKPLAIEVIDAKAREHYTYLKDPAGLDTWRSHAGAVLGGMDWQGDCDDLASTVLDLLGRDEMALEDRFMLAVSSEGDQTADHLVGACIDDDGRFWVVGDTFRAAYPAEQMEHRPIKYHRLSELGPPLTWRSLAPWMVKA